MLKRISSLSLSIFLVAGFSLFLTLKQAHAYIDLATGAYYIQIIIAAGFGSLFTIKVFWGRIIGKLGRLVSIVKDNKEKPE